MQLTISLVGLGLLALIMIVEWSERKRHAAGSLRDIPLSSDEMLRHIRLMEPSLRKRGAARPRLPASISGDLKKAEKFLNRMDPKTLLPAAQWLLDNMRRIEEDLQSVRYELKRQKRLPRTASGTVRVMKLAQEMVSHSGALVTREMCIRCIEAYYRVCPMTQAELYALPLAIKITLLALIDEMAVHILALEKDAADAARLAAALSSKRRLNPRAFGKRSTAFWEKLLSALKESEDADGAVWVQEQMRAFDLDALEIVQTEHLRQSEHRRWVGNAITSLKTVNQLPWQELLEKHNPIHHILSGDGSGVYPKMDFESREYYRNRVERLSRLMDVPESRLAQAACSLSQKGKDDGIRDHVGFYLLEALGERALKKELGASRAGFTLHLFLKKHARGLYRLMLFIWALLTLAALICLKVPFYAALPVLLLSSQLIRKGIRLAAAHFLPVRKLPRLEIDALDEKRRCLVVIPTLMTNAAQALAMARQLSVLHHANPDPQLHFMLLADFADSDTQETVGDQEIVSAGRAAIEALCGQIPATSFFYVHRGRSFNPKEQRYMGRERKRGALEFLNLFLTGTQCGDPVVFSSVDLNALAHRYAYVITLDSDTIMPPGSAKRLVGAMAHPLNVRKRVDGRMRGFSIIAPRMEVSAWTVRTRVSLLWGGSGGVDPYNAAVSEMYQDLCCQGSFTGKGIYTPDTFLEATAPFLRPNRILSHDLIEGELSGCALASDIVLYDGHPKTIEGFLKRLHRWTRGDWQLVPWLSPLAPGQAKGTPISAFSRHKIWDNLLRSLVPPARLILLIISVIRRDPWLFVLSLLLSDIDVLINPSWQALCAYLTRLMYLPREAYTLIDAVLRTLYRVFVSHKHLLQWVTAAQVDSGPKEAALDATIQYGTGVLTLLCALLPWPPFIPGIAAALLFGAAPLAVSRLNGSLHQLPVLTADEKTQALNLAQQTYQFFDALVDEENNFLPPDNLQLHPNKGTVKRTSPTNIGLYLLSLVAAESLELIDADQMGRLMEKTTDTLERLTKWEGHFYNWYDTHTLEPLPPYFVSSVDSGNLMACLLAAAQALRTLAPKMDASLYNLSSRLDDLAYAMALEKLFDPTAQLFHIGYDAKNERLTEGLYDLLASEARLLSYVAIMTQKVPIRHWSRLGRTLIRAEKCVTLLSWSGTMFEYLMPHLLLPLVPGTLLSAAAKSAVRIQAKHRLGGVFGVSESGYFAFDPSLNYQYKAFGLKQLALSNETSDQVIAPYASMLAFPLFPHEVLKNLQRMRAMKWQDSFGLYEAADFDKRHVGNAPYELIKSHMAHHQGMILCALCNGLKDNALQKYFFALPVARAYATLLEESMPGFVFKSRPRKQSGSRGPKPVLSAATRRAQPYVFPLDAHLLYGAGTTLMVDAHGNGFLKRNGTMISRFYETAGEVTGIRFYLKDVQRNTLYHLTDPDVPGETVFQTGKAVFTRRFEGFETHLSFFVNPVDGAALQLVEIVNLTADEMTLELADYFELALNGQKQDSGHPCFGDLFIETGRVGKNALFARRRPKDGSGVSAIMTHALCGEGEAMHTVLQTDRQAFLGRNSTPLDPLQLSEDIERSAGHIGAPIHPCASIRTRFLLPAHGKTKFLFVTLYEDETRLMPFAVAERYHSVAEGLRVMDLSLTHGLVTMRYLALSEQLMNLYGRLSGALLFSGQPHRHFKNMCRVGMEGLWSLGVSGDLPVMSVFVAKRDHLPLLKTTLAAHSLYRMQGFWVDLLIVVTELPSYDRPLHTAITELISLSDGGELLNRPGGFHLIEAAALSDELTEMIKAASRLTLRGEDGPLSAQLQGLIRPFEPMPTEAPAPPAPALPPLARDFFNGFGGFAGPDKEYVIDLVNAVPTPAPWCNMICTERFGSLVSESGFEFTYFENSHGGRLTRFYNDPIEHRSGEGLLIWDMDEQRLFSPTLMPRGGALNHRCTHSFGVTTYFSKGLSLECTLTVFTDSEYPVSVRTLRVKNTGQTTRRLRISHYADFLMGSVETDAAMTGVLIENGVLAAQNPDFPGMAFLCSLSGPEHTSLGVYSRASILFTDLMARQDLGPDEPGTTGVATNEAVLKAEQSVTLTFLFGAARDMDGVTACRDAFLRDGITARLRQVKAGWLTKLDALRFSLPDEKLNIMMNRWLPYQVRTSRLFARAGFYQAGGAIGYRDQLQDMVALMHIEPEKARAHILVCAAHQYEEGDVQHWWHPERRGVRTHISDDMLFLPYITAWYIKRTGDTSILKEEVPYLSAAPLGENEHDRYHTPELTAYTQPLLEHCMKAIFRPTFGPHGLPCMRGGDWNDGMSSVGGESVWLGFFMATLLRDFAPLTGEDVRPRLLDLRDSLLRSIDQHAWDGAWYLRAWYQNGEPLGSAQSGACRIDSLSQSWAVLSGIGRDRAGQALKEAYDQLFLPDIGVMRLLTPPFGPTDKAGYICGYLPGVRENGGQYTHAVPWVIWAMKEMGWRDKAWELTDAVNPISHAMDIAGAMRYRLEPYFMAGDVYSNEKQYGRGGWSMYTGSAAWLYTVVLEQLLGFSRHGDTFRMRPFVPDSWDDFSITFLYGQSTWHITASRDVVYPTLDGEKLTHGSFSLVDDGRIHDARFRIAPLT